MELIVAKLDLIEMNTVPLWKYLTPIYTHT